MSRGWGGRVSALGVAVGVVVAGLALVARPAAASGRAGAASASDATRSVPGPRHAGMPRIAGALRDGGVVRAAGLSWKPGRLPKGDRLLSFAVGYQWQSCASAAASSCRPAADSTRTPFAARRYIVGHADVGRELRVVETAAETVETDPATFSFSVIRTSATVAAHRRAAGFPAGGTPLTEFVNGVPEQRTGSDSEYFGVDPPHYAAGSGRPAMSYRIDGGRWRRLQASGVFYTGKLGVGEHTVAVRTSDLAGASLLPFSWRVTRLPAPLACRRPGSRGACWLPPHLNSAGKPMRWDWQIGRVTPLERTGASAVDFYDIDGFLTTPAEVRAIRTRWQAATLPHPRTACYLDLAWEDYRPDGSPGQRAGFPAAALGNVYFGFPQERWVDFRQLNALKPMIDARLEMCARKGFDAVELDDIDSFDPPSTTGFHLTAGDAQNLLAYAFNEIHRLGMAGLWKNSPLLSRWGLRYADGAVVEECYTFGPCSAWRDFSTDKTAAQPSGKWVGEVEYGADHFVCDPGQTGPKCEGRRSFASFCRNVYAPAYGFSAMKLDVDLDGKTFLPCPAGR